MSDGIECRSCERNMIPQLYHYGGSLFSYSKTQHLCPYCGAVQHNSGGGFKAWVKITVVIIVLPILIQLVKRKFNLI